MTAWLTRPQPRRDRTARTRPRRERGACARRSGVGQAQSVRRSPHAPASVGAARAGAARRVRAAAAPRSPRLGRAAGRPALRRLPRRARRRADRLAAAGDDAGRRRARCCVLDGALRARDCSTCSSAAPAPRPRDLPTEFSPAAEAMVARLGAMIAAPLTRRLGAAGARSTSRRGRVEANAAMLARHRRRRRGDRHPLRHRRAATAKPVFLDLLYPVAALKPHGAVADRQGRRQGRRARSRVAHRADPRGDGRALPGPLGARRAGRAAADADGPEARRRHPDQLRRRRAGDGRQRPPRHRHRRHLQRPRRDPPHLARTVIEGLDQ